MDSSPSLIKPALISGVIFGFVISIPGFDLVNTCTCCSMILGAGILAAFLYSRDCERSGVEFSAGQGALVGLVTAMFLAPTNALVGTVIHVAIGNPVAIAMADFVLASPDVPPEFVDMIEQARDELETHTFTALAFVFNLVKISFLAAIFCTGGGLIGGALFKVEPPAPAEPAPPAAGPPPVPPTGAGQV
jgi:hypothetical protein